MDWSESLRKMGSETKIGTRVSRPEVPQDGSRLPGYYVVTRLHQS